MSNSVVEELEFEKSIEDFLLEANQLEDSDHLHVTSNGYLIINFKP